MSIKDEIIRIKNNITNAYSACQNKGAECPILQNSENLAKTISSISGNSATKYGITVDNFLGDIDKTGKIQTPQSGILNAKGVVEVDDYTLACKFGGSAWGTSRPQGLSQIIFPDLRHIGIAGLAYFYTYSTDLESVSFPELEEIGLCGMQCGFQWNSNLKSASFPKLKRLTGMYSSLQQTFYYCENLEQVNLDSLESLTRQALNSAFEGCTNLKALYFPSLTPESFGDYTDQFDDMLRNVTKCTVHFPFAIKDIISHWNSVIQGFGGNNTIILFDLHTAILNFITNNPNIIFGINGRKISGNSGYAEPGTGTYSCYDRATNILFLETLNDLNEDEIIDINIDERLTQQSNKIMIATGISGLDVIFKVCGLSIPAIEESTGIYVLNTISNNDKISYFVDGGDLYSDEEGSFITTGEDISISVNLKSATWKNFEQPNLTENGVLGKDSFAVSEEGMLGSSYSAYHAFDGISSNYTWASTDPSTITFYNPKPLKVSKLVVTYSQNSTTYQAKKIIVQGSNDNENWVDLAEVGYQSGISREIEVNSKKAYKYHKLTFTIYSIYIRITDINITAAQKE